MLRCAGALFLAFLVAAEAGAQGNDRSPSDRLLITAGSALVDASVGNWEAAARHVGELETQWRALSPTGSRLAHGVDDALAAALHSLGSASSHPEEAASALSRLASAVDSYVSATQGASGTAVAAGVPQLLGIAREGLRRARSGDADAAAMQVKLFSSEWTKSETGIRQRDAAAYAAIEIGMSRAGAALRASPPNLPAARESLESMTQALEDYARGTSTTSNAAQVSVPSGPHGVSDLLALLHQSANELAAGDQRAASNTMERFVEMWPVAEGEVMARSPAAYTATEADMTEAEALLLSATTDRGRTLALIRGMADRLAEIGTQKGYSFWDSAIILLREGLEALLVLAALLALLKKSERRGSDGWVWAGAGTGVVLSAALAVIMGLVLTSAAGGAAREGVEGFVGLASVLLMLTIGAWLHRRSSLQSWNAYLKSRVGSALATGSMWSVFALACLAVLREGAETVVFYAGIAPAISPLELFGGIGAALLLLVVIGFLIIRYSVKLPLHVFFLVATLLIYYLAVKVTGESLHALQMAGTLPSHFIDGFPVLGPLGVFATWETFAPQAIIFLMVVAEIVVTEIRRFAGRRAARVPAAPSAR